MKTDSDTIGKKISRLEFLRLLGAGAIGYFAYRAGFINSLFGNATATATIPGSIPLSQPPVPSAATENLDEDGILMMGTPKPGGYSYRFNPSLFPSNDIRLDVGDTAGFEIKQESNVKFMRFMSHNPGTGEGNNTARIHVYTKDRADQDRQQYDWINGAQEMGWLTHPNDLKNGEWTFICRPNKILDDSNAISAKLGVGEHTVDSPDNCKASCWNVNWYYKITRTNTNL